MIGAEEERVYCPATLIRDRNNDRSSRIETFGAPSLCRTAVRFDGQDDGIVLHENCVSGAREFHVKVHFCPRKGGSVEQRFFHIQAEGNGGRVLLEVRLMEGKYWYADSFFRSGTDEVVLQDPKQLHPLEEWYEYEVSYCDNVFSHSINGTVECWASLEGARAPEGGVTAIGFRATRDHHFCGDIRSIVLRVPE